MRIGSSTAIVLIALGLALNAHAQMTLSGRLVMPRHPGTEQPYYFTAIPSFASPGGSQAQALTCRTWQTEPAGWYRFSGNAGAYALVFSNPADFMRPVIRTNVFTFHGDDRVWNLAPGFDFSSFDDGAWDEAPANEYFQTFRALGTSITHVGFKLAHDGVDGEGPEGQYLLVSIHRVTGDDPRDWPRIGPEALVPVNCGGSLNQPFSVGWNSGEVETVPGEGYAVRIAAREPGGSFQAFWSREKRIEGDCYRVTSPGPVKVEHDLWLAVGSDSDGLTIPYNKRYHPSFHDLTEWGPRWSQTYVSRGRGLAAVVLFAAVAGDQPPLVEQRAVVRVLRGGPGGPQAGIPKIATGQGTATAMGGVFGAAFAPGEVPLEPGETYAIQFDALGPGSGFNPIRKHPPDEYPDGTAWFMGQTPMDYDLDMQIVEYENTDPDWENAVTGENLLRNGDFQQGEYVAGNKDAGTVVAWDRFTIDPGTAFWYQEEEGESPERYATVIGGSISGRTVDGGYVQAVCGLSREETYRVSGRIRSSLAVDTLHQCRIGIDPTGQTQDPEAGTIRWEILPGVHDVFVPWVSDPICPATACISVWLRGRTESTRGKPFVADFDDFAMKRVDTGVPGR